MAAQRRRRARATEQLDQRRGGTGTEDVPSALFGPWRILHRLGEGAHGVVYEAEHQHIPGKRAALKILHRHHYSEAARRLFFREAQAASRVAHPGIVQVYDVATTPQGHCYLVMELIRGQALGSLAMPLQLTRALDLLQQIALAMAEVHAHGVIHRDLKPQNVMVESLGPGHRERARILDFGVAKLLAQAPGAPHTVSGALLGTPAYMSREQWISPNDIDCRADIYAVGVMAYEVLLGRLPFHGRTHYDWQQAHLRQAVPQPATFRALPRRLQRLLLAMLAKHRDDRPSDMPQVAAELAQIEDAVRDTQSAATSARQLSASGARKRERFLRDVVWGTAILMLQQLPSDQSHVPVPAHPQRPVARVQRPQESSASGKSRPLTAFSEDSLHRAAAQQHTRAKKDEATGTGALAREDPTERVARLPAMETGLAQTATPLAAPPRGEAVVAGLQAPSARDEPAFAKRPDLWLQFRRWLRGSWWDPGMEAAPVATRSLGLASSDSRGPRNPRTPALLLQWRVAPPLGLSSLRISADGQPLSLIGANAASPVEPGWVRYTQDRWLLSEDQAPQHPTRFSIEVRDEYGCWVGAGFTDVDQPSTVDNLYVPIDAPSNTEHARIELRRVVMGTDTPSDGLAAIEASAGQRLIDCGPRCRCTVPKNAVLSLTGQGSEAHPFVAWEAAPCEGKNPCKTTAAQLMQPDGTAVVTARYASWLGEQDGFQTLQPPLIALSLDQHRFFQAQLKDRNRAEYSNPSQLRTLSAPINGSLWMAGRGGVLIRWDAERRAFRRTQMGKVDAGFPPASGVQSPQPRLLDFFGIAEDRNQRAYAVGAEDLGKDMDPMANAYHFDGEAWSQDLFVEERTLTQHNSVLLGRRVLRGVIASQDGGSVIAVGLDGNIFERGVGILVNPDPDEHKQNLWGIAGDPRSHMIIGASVRAKQRPVLLHRRGTGPFQLVGDPPPFEVRTAWATPDGSEYWVGGIGKEVIRYVQGPRGGLVRAEMPCTYGPVAPSVILGIWGTGPDDVWLAGGDRILHCAGQGLWELKHQLEPGFEFVGLQGERGGDLWAVGFMRSKAANPDAPIDPERTDRSLIIRLPRGGVHRP